MCKKRFMFSEGQLSVGDFRNRLAMCHSDVSLPFTQACCLETCRSLSLFLGLWTPLSFRLLLQLFLFILPPPDSWIKLQVSYFFLSYFLFLWIFALILELFLSFDHLSNLFGIHKCPFSPSSTKFLGQIILFKKPTGQWHRTPVS